jgi:hypothetical protein
LDLIPKLKIQQQQPGLVGKLGVLEEPELQRLAQV